MHPENGERPARGARQRTSGGEPSPRTSYPAPGPDEYETTFHLLECVGRAHRVGRPVRLELSPEDLPGLLMAVADVAALAVREVDRLAPDGPPFLERLRQFGGDAA
jgi:hypothetical protein